MKKVVVVHDRGEVIEKRTSTLTPREWEVLLLVVQSKSNKEIAEELGITQKTVEKHRGAGMQKCRVRDVAALTRVMIESSGHCTIYFNGGKHSPDDQMLLAVFSEAESIFVASHAARLEMTPVEFGHHLVRVYMKAVEPVLPILARLPPEARAHVEEGGGRPTLHAEPPEEREP